MRQKMSFGELPQEKGCLSEGESLRIPLAGENACDNEPGVDPEGIRLSQRLEVKTCPVCGARCFSDMDICYNCLHSFAHDKTKTREASRNQNGRFETAVYDTDCDPALDFESSGGEEGACNLQSSGNRSKSLMGEMAGAGIAECEEDSTDNAKTSLVNLDKGVEVIVNISFAKSPCSKNGEMAPTVMVETR